MTAAATTPTPPSLPLRIHDLVKRFGELTAVNGVSLELNPGECLGLLGPNGAGKSTLIRSIVGRVIPDSGTALVFGSPADSNQARMALGWVPQDLALYPRLTCRENLEAFGQYHGLSRTSLNGAITSCLDWAGLADRADHLVSSFSGGMKRRLNMAAGLIHSPKVILMDEPTVGVDPQSRNRIFEMIEKLRTQGISMVYTTHYMEEAERLCDRIAIIDHGRIIAQGTKEDLLTDAFASRSEVFARFGKTDESVSAWVKERGGAFDNGIARFTLERPTEIASLLESAAAARHELVDVSLRKPNLESVFLHLTGRELRD
ncbi:MAG: ABC transporter ATP-binding protein [Acidobacteria bacterium]|nr:ABC transporter ATP-binding protein [Acidobacteriota bacterium]